MTTVSIWQYFKKENIYMVYNNEISNCQQIDMDEKNKYPLCHNGKYFFEKINTKPIISINNLNSLKLTSKKTFFKYSNFKNKNIFLVIKKGEAYEVIPVKMFQILS